MKPVKLDPTFEDALFATKTTITKLTEFQDLEFTRLWEAHKEHLIKSLESEEQANDFLFDYIYNHSSENEDFGDYLIRLGYVVE